MLIYLCISPTGMGDPEKQPGILDPVMDYGFPQALEWCFAFFGGGAFKQSFSDRTGFSFTCLMCSHQFILHFSYIYSDITFFNSLT